MDTICVKAFIDDFRHCEETRYGSIRYDDMHGSKGLLLVKTPDVEFVDREDAWDLYNTL